MEIKIFIRTTEPWSQTLVEYLNRKHIAYSKKDVSVDAQSFQEMVQKTGQKKVPVIEIGDKIIIGFNKSYLEEMLASDNI